MSALEKSAVPRYRRGQLVEYIDMHDRVQQGRVRALDARWPGYSKAGEEPYIVYMLEHPTYRNNHCGRTDKDILRALEV